MPDRMVLFSMTLSDPNPGFKVTVYLQVEYLADRLVFEAEASEGEVRQVVSPTLPFPLSLPSPFPFPLHPFLTSGREGQIQFDARSVCGS